MLVMQLTFAGLWLAAWGFVIALIIRDEIAWRRKHGKRGE